MPTYDYQCDACGHTFEHFQSIKDDALTKCPECKKKKLRRLIGAGAAIVFKGSGFYQTDYRSDSYRKKAASEKSASDSGSSGSDSSSSAKSSTDKGSSGKSSSGEGKSSSKSDS